MKEDDLYEFSKRGRDLASCRDPESAQQNFDRWVSEIGDWLNNEFPSPQIAISWLGLGTANLSSGGHYQDNPAVWADFRNQIDQRLNWLSRFVEESTRRQAPEKTQAKAVSEGRREVQLNTKARAFVDPDRIEELRRLRSSEFDFTRLIRLCEELNLCYAVECYLATSMVTRSILDHVPPLFMVKSFAEVANNYSGGTRSFKDSMKKLEESSRKISDMNLHTQIRKSEILPNARQVDFSQDIDVLLGEIVRAHKSA